MAVSRTVIEIYNDAAMQSLNQTVTTNSDANPVAVGSLSPGTRYWATITARENNRDSSTSTPYPFTTMPDAVFTDAPTVDGTIAEYSMETTSNEVGVRRCGCAWSLSTQFTSPSYDWGPHASRHGYISLQQGETYYLWAVVEDEYGRFWRNPAYETVAAGYAPPEVRLNSIVAYSDTARGIVDVRSLIPVDLVSVKLQAAGGGPTMDATVPSVGTGAQQWTIGSLTPDTVYNVYASARNASGTGTAQSQLRTAISGNRVSLDDAFTNASDPYHSIYTEVQGYVDSGNDIEYVGAAAFLSNDHTGTPVAAAYSGSGEDYLSENLWGLTPGTTYWVFAFMRYCYDNTDYYLIWSEGQPVTTSAEPVPIVAVTDVDDITTTSATATVSITF